MYREISVLFGPNNVLITSISTQKLLFFRDIEDFILTFCSKYIYIYILFYSHQTQDSHTNMLKVTGNETSYSSIAEDSQRALSPSPKVTERTERNKTTFLLEASCSPRASVSGTAQLKIYNHENPKTSHLLFENTKN